MRPSTCEQAALWISCRVDGELRSGAETAALDSHLLRCGACRDLHADESARARSLGAALSAGAAETAAIAQAVLARVGDPEEHRAGVVESFQPRTRWTRWVAATAAAVFLASVWIGWQLLPGARTPPAGAELRYVWEETLESSRLLPDENGAPVRRDVELRRRWILPAREAGGPDGGLRGGGVGIEKVDARNVHLVRWPYR